MASKVDKLSAWWEKHKETRGLEDVKPADMATSPHWQAVVWLGLIVIAALALGVVALAQEYSDDDSQTYVGLVTVRPGDSEADTATLDTFGRQMANTLARTDGGGGQANPADQDLQFIVQGSGKVLGALYRRQNVVAIESSDFVTSVSSTTIGTFIQSTYEVVGQQSGSVFLVTVVNDANFTIRLPNAVSPDSIVTPSGGELVVDPRGWKFTFIVVSVDGSGLSVQLATTDGSSIRGQSGSLVDGLVTRTESSSWKYSGDGHGSQISVVFNNNSWITEGVAWGWD